MTKKINVIFVSIVASVCIFKLFPKTSIKSTKLGGNIMENINMIGNFFNKPSVTILIRIRLRAAVQQSVQEKGHEQNLLSIHYIIIQTSGESADGSLLKKNPLYRLYSPSNPVLR